VLCYFRLWGHILYNKQNQTRATGGSFHPKYFKNEGMVRGKGGGGMPWLLELFTALQRQQQPSRNRIYSLQYRE
jgi:hypothetical protein